jgi:hypothetical protein
MKTKSLVLCALALVLTLTIHNALAVPQSYTIADWDATSSNPIIGINVLAEPAPFILDDSGEQTFDFFTINSSVFTATTSINAAINFSDPAQEVDITGAAGAVFANYSTDFNTPQTFALADRTFSVTLSEPSFQTRTPATVTATIRQLSSNVSVPDSGSTGMLLGLGFLVIAFASRRRFAAS